MSKSIGNVICPLASLKKYTKDGLRYFLLREGVPATDCNIHEEKFKNFVNVELVNTLCNLYQRCLPFNKDQIYMPYNQIESALSDDEKVFLSTLNSLRETCSKDYDDFNFYLGIQSIMSHVRQANLRIQENKPWELVKSNNNSERESLSKLMFLVNETLRISSILLQPIVPDLAGDILDRLSVTNEQRFFANAQVDYARTESKKMVKKSDVIFKRL